jgi:hypothetical protein
MRFIVTSCARFVTMGDDFYVRYYVVSGVVKFFV